MYEINEYRIKNCIKRAKAGEQITVGFLGGSITQGSLATKDEFSYAYRVFSWWKNTFPNANIKYVNGGIGGTTSHYGVSRAITDVLMYQPDIVIVDFSVNDDANEFFEETYEGVIRKLLLWQSQPAVILLNNVYYDTGENAQEYHNKIGEWYKIPYVSIKDTIYQQIKLGVYKRDELTTDGLHPNDKGHELVANEIIKYLSSIDENIADTEYIVPDAMTANAYENAKRLTIREFCPVLSGFHADTEEKLGHLDNFKNGWIGSNDGDSIIFNVEASCIAVQYRKTIKKPAVKAWLTLDNDKKFLLDANFEEDWGDCLYLQTILHHGEMKMHKIEICIENEDGQEKTPFYLLSLIIA